MFPPAGAAFVQFRPGCVRVEAQGGLICGSVVEIAGDASIFAKAVRFEASPTSNIRSAIEFLNVERELSTSVDGNLPL